MKKMKRILAFALAMVMILAMNMTVFADNDTTPAKYSITINNAESGHTYEAYQIFAGDLSEGVLSNMKWGAGVTAAGQTALGNAATKAESLENATDAKTRAFAEAMSVYLGTASKSVNTATGDKYVMDGLDAGYYLIKDKDGSMQDSENAYTLFILQVTGNQEVAAKSDKPTVIKKVMDTNDSTAVTTGWQDSADYDIGDRVPFQLTATLPKNMDKYTTYKVVFHDTLSAGLTYNVDYTVKINGKEVDKENFTPAYEGTSLSFACNDVVALGATNNSTIEIVYSATLNENAVIGSEGNPNEVYLEFSNNPNNSGFGNTETGKTPTDKVIVFTYKVDINKINEKEEPLNGAAFKLEKSITGVAGNANQWITVKEYEAKEDQNAFEFTGIDDGTYRITETATPDGYNTIDPIEFTVVAEHDAAADEPKLKSLTGNKASGDVFVSAVTFEGNTSPTGTLSGNIINFSGSTLPSTGGTGRVLIYTVGAILAFVAGIVLVAKKRAAK